MKKYTINQQIFNAYKRGLSVDLIAECTYKTREQVRRIISVRLKSLQGEQTTKETSGRA